MPLPRRAKFIWVQSARQWRFRQISNAGKAPAKPPIATCQRNISQNCWAQHVVCVWPPCWDMLQHVECCWLKFENGRGVRGISSVNSEFGRPLIPSDFLQYENCNLELSWHEKFSVCYFRIVKNVVLSTEKRSAIIFGKAITPKVFGKWRKKP